MDYSSEVEKLIPLFLEVDMYNLPAMVKATESMLKDNHLKIIEFLEANKVDPETIKMLKDQLKLCEG